VSYVFYGAGSPRLDRGAYDSELMVLSCMWRLGCDAQPFYGCRNPDVFAAKLSAGSIFHPFINFFFFRRLWALQASSRTWDPNITSFQVRVISLQGPFFTVSFWPMCTAPF